VALALCGDGWWLRDEIVWHKPNPMPSSVDDRTTPAHEMVYLLSKRARYFYDTDAIRERSIGTTEHDLTGLGTRSQPPGTSPQNGNRRRVQSARALSFERETKESLVPGQAAKQHRLGRTKVPGGWDIEPGGHGTVHHGGRTSATYREASFVGQGNPASERQRVGINDRWNETVDNGTVRLGRNKRSVWTIATQPYAEAHFATFPEKLVEPMILAGCPVGGVVLDPFGGSGTVAMVSNRLGRSAVHIDLSAEYTEQAFARIARARGAGDGPAVDMPVPFAGDGLWAETVP
jgi:hypothetical protein